MFGKNVLLSAFLLLSLTNLHGQCGSIDFYNGVWDNNAAAGFNTSSNSGSTTLPCGVTVTVTFGSMGNGNYSGVDIVNLAAVNGFVMKTGASYSIDQLGNTLANAVTMEVVFSEPSWVEDWTLGDVDASWNSNWKTWRESIFIEGWTTTAPGAMGSGDIDAVYSDIGSNFEATQTVLNGVTGYANRTSSSPALHENAEIDFSIGTAANPIKSFRLYLVNKGNLTQNSGHNITVQNPDDGPISVSSSATLPVQLASFSAEDTRDAVALHWSTTSEVNNKEFVVERSVDGKVFEFVKAIKSKGNSFKSQYYNYMDQRMNVPQLYYRLKQIDHNGGYSYSEIVVVALDRGFNSDALDVAVYPNPTSDVVHVHGTMDLSDCNIHIYDMLGQLQTSIHRPMQSMLDLTGLKSGHYILQISDSSGAVIASRRIARL